MIPSFLAGTVGYGRSPGCGLIYIDGGDLVELMQAFFPPLSLVEAVPFSFPHEDEGWTFDRTGYRSFVYFPRPWEPFIKREVVVPSFPL